MNNPSRMHKGTFLNYCEGSISTYYGLFADLHKSANVEKIILTLSNGFFSPKAAKIFRVME